MYTVIETQLNGGVLAVLSYTNLTKAQAGQKYHEVLSYAAISGIEKHSATLLNDEGRVLRYECYKNGSVESEVTA